MVTESASTFLAGTGTGKHTNADPKDIKKGREMVEHLNGPKEILTVVMIPQKGNKMQITSYELSPAVNKSTLWEMRKSPLHYWHLMHDTPKPDTPAMKFGRAVHKRILEPVEFSADYAVAPVCDRRTKEGKAIWAELQESGKEIISAEDMETIEAMEKEFPFELLKDAVREVPLFWAVLSLRHAYLFCSWHCRCASCRFFSDLCPCGTLPHRAEA